jgi:hypothetical protein
LQYGSNTSIEGLTSQLLENQFQCKEVIMPNQNENESQQDSESNEDYIMKDCDEEVNVKQIKEE